MSFNQSIDIKGLSCKDVNIYMYNYYKNGFIGIIDNPNKIKKFYKLNHPKHENLEITFIIFKKHHFTSVYIDNENIDYYDSCAKPPHRLYINKIQKFANFIRNKKMNLRYNKVRHQGSTGNCGYFAINYLFALTEYKINISWDEEKDDSINGEIIINNFKNSADLKSCYESNIYHIGKNNR